jgi:CheY-like chemotaxis protein
MVKTDSKLIMNARTGAEVVDIFKNNPEIDVLLMDIQMLVLNGFEATRQLRLFNKDVIIIAQTASGLSEDQEKLIALSCNDYMSKPLNKNKLRGLLHKYFTK